MLVASTVGTLAGISVPVGRPAAHRQGSGGTWLEPRRWRRGGPVQAGALWTGTCPVDDARAVAAVRPTVRACLHTPARRPGPPPPPAPAPAPGGPGPRRGGGGGWGGAGGGGGGRAGGGRPAGG